MKGFAEIKLPPSGFCDFEDERMFKKKENHQKRCWDKYIKCLRHFGLEML